MLKKDMIGLLVDIEKSGCLPPDLANRVTEALRGEKTTTSVPTDISDFVVAYYDWLSHNGGKKRQTIREIERAETALVRLVRIDGYSFKEEVVPALRSAVQNTFWSALVRSLGQLRCKSKNEAMRFDNLFAAYSAANTNLKPVAITKKEVVNEQRDDRAARRLQRRLAKQSTETGSGGRSGRNRLVG